MYDLYAAEDIQHPDGVTGTVNYGKITYADGTPIWHTTIRDNSGQWVDDYLPVLAKDHLVASAVIKDGWLTFSNLYLGKYYIVERGTGVVIPVEDGAYKLSGTYPDVDAKTKEPTGTTSQLAANSAGQYTDYVYKNQWSYIGEGYALDGTHTYDGYYESYATGYLCDELYVYLFRHTPMKAGTSKRLPLRMIGRLKVRISTKRPTVLITTCTGTTSRPKAMTR